MAYYNLFYITDPATYAKANGLPSFRDGRAGDIVAFQESREPAAAGDAPLGCGVVSFDGSDPKFCVSIPGRGKVPVFQDGHNFRVCMKVDVATGLLVPLAQPPAPVRRNLNPAGVIAT